MSTIADHLAEEKNRLQKALDHLDYSFNKVKKLSTDPKQMDDETLEVWESFSARFGRVSDIF